MKPNLTRRIASVCLLACLQISLFAKDGNDYLLKDESALRYIKKGLKEVYNMNFEAARSEFDVVASRYPEHPSTPFLQSMVMYWQNIPLDVNQPYIERYVGLLEKTIDLSEKRFERFDNEEEMEGVFFALSAHGLLAKHYSNVKQYSTAIGQARKVYKYVKLGKAMKEAFKEFYFIVGLYDYYREYYPKLHPTYNTVAWMFMSGDMEKGLEELKHASAHTVFVANEADIYLTSIYLHCEGNSEMAIQTAKKLTERYPQNLFFKAQYAETLINTQNYQKAKPMIGELLSVQRDEYYVMVGKIFEGYLLDLVEGEPEKALVRYDEALEIAQRLGSRPHEVLVYLHAGKYRVYMKNGQEDLARQEYKLAKEHDDYDYMKEVKGEF